MNCIQSLMIQASVWIFLTESSVSIQDWNGLRILQDVFRSVEMGSQLVIQPQVKVPQLTLFQPVTK
jgi:hypothetical protein